MKPIETKHTEQLNTQLSVEETDNKKSNLTEREYIEDTPFWLIMQNERWYITMAGFKITKEYTTKEEALERLEKDKWKIVMHVALIIKETKPPKELSQRELELAAQGG